MDDGSSPCTWGLTVAIYYYTAFMGEFPMYVGINRLQVEMFILILGVPHVRGD